MQEFNKKYWANDLYGLPKEFQESVDFALTSSAAEQIIDRHSEPGMKARFQHIREAKVLGFIVEPYTDIGPTKLSFSLNDPHYLRGHFQVFSIVSLFPPHQKRK